MIEWSSIVIINVQFNWQRIMCFILELSILMYNITNFGKSSTRASSYCEDPYKWKWSGHVYQAKWTYLPSQLLRRSSKLFRLHSCHSILRWHCNPGRAIAVQVIVLIVLVWYKVSLCWFENIEYIYSPKWRFEDSWCIMEDSCKEDYEKNIGRRSKHRKTS